MLRRHHVYPATDPTRALCGHTRTTTRTPTPGQLHPWEGYCPACVHHLAAMLEAATANRPRHLRAVR